MVITLDFRARLGDDMAASESEMAKGGRGAPERSRDRLLAKTWACERDKSNVAGLPVARSMDN